MRCNLLVYCVRNLELPNSMQCKVRKDCYMIASDHSWTGWMQTANVAQVGNRAHELKLLLFPSHCTPGPLMRLLYCQR